VILLWGTSGDDPLNAVLGSLRRREARFAFLDQRDVLDTTVELTAGPHLGGTVRVGQRSIALDEVTAIYMRQYEARKLPDVLAAGEAGLAHVGQVETALWSFCEVADACVVNRPSAMATNASKPYQSALIRATGFLVPPTLLTTDPAAAREFWQRHGTVIYKSVSSVRSIVSRLGPDDAGRLDDLGACPIQLQAFVPGQDIRVHVVGDDVFASAVDSGADDYRYASRQGSSVDMQAYELPAEVAALCRRLAKKLDFMLAGIDLRRTPDGRWYCFEVNPSPSYTFYQQFTCQPISETLTQLLVDAPKS